MSDDEDRGGSIVLRASAARWVWTLIGSLAFALFGGAMILSELTGAVAKGIGVVLFVLFGLCALVALREMRAPGSLTISRDDMNIVSRGRLTTFALADCSRFWTWRNPSRGSTHVVFDYAGDPDTELTRTNRKLMGGSRSLHESYGVSTESLVDLLNQARTAGLSGDRDESDETDDLD
ncbi:MAG: hypothetical protein JWN39_1321 [Ilumatobacteraceae bacterium]|nr:hypothetical protein [Ilumatobacteraceae bacterium]